MRSLFFAVLVIGAPAEQLFAQAIEFEQNGLRYQTLTKNGLTIMFTTLPTHVRPYEILQVAISNGSEVSWTVKPEDFVFQRADGTSIAPDPPRSVVDRMLTSSGRGDVIKMVSTYELGLYGLSRLNSTSGYEKRRQSALAEVSSAKLKAAAAASAVVYVSTKLQPGQSTDGALFYGVAGKPLGSGKLVIRAAGEIFEFHRDPPVPDGGSAR